MKSFSVISTLSISPFAFEKLKTGYSSLESATKKAVDFPECDAILVLSALENSKLISNTLSNIHFEKKIEIKIKELAEISVQIIFDEISKFAVSLGDEYKNIFFLYGDTPFYDLNLIKKLYEQHIEYGAEYSFVDGYPEGLAPEIIATGLCPILAEVAKLNSQPITRFFIFDTIKKEINNYDIETIIAPYDLRHLRLQFICNNKRNAFLCNQFIGINSENYASMIEEKKELLFTLPAYYQIDLNSSNVVNSIYNPPVLSKNKQMDKKDAFLIIDKIAKFSDDAIISLSVYGEPSLYDEIETVIEKILTYPKLSVLIETSGLKWKDSTIEKIDQIVKKSKPRQNEYLAIYWIVGIDAVSSVMYSKIHKLPEADANLNLKEAASFVNKINKLFKDSVWTQIVRMNENEVEVEPFYRFWKNLNINVIIQKYNSFCKMLADKRVADLSPYYRHPCWHIKRDLCILADGSVPMCREDFKCKKILGNVLKDSFENIRKNAFEIYSMHLNSNYGGLCEFCDEYYTYNF